MKKNEFGCNLYIGTDSYHPSIVTELTGVQYSKIQVKGETYTTPNGKVIPQKIFEENLWIFEQERKHENVEYYINESISEMFLMLHSHKESFEKVFNMFRNRHISCYAYYYEYNPYFIIKKELMQAFQDFNIDIEFDLYFLGDTKDE